MRNLNLDSIQSFKWNEILEEVLNLRSVQLNTKERVKVQLQFLDSDSHLDRDLVLHKLLQLAICKDFNAGFHTDLIHLKLISEYGTTSFETIFSQLDDFIFISKLSIEGCGLYGDNLLKIGDSPFSHFLPRLELEAKKKGVKNIILNSPTSNQHLYYFTQGYSSYNNAPTLINSTTANNLLLIKPL